MHIVVGAHQISIIDGSLDYKQIIFHEEYKEYLLCNALGGIHVRQNTFRFDDHMGNFSKRFGYRFCRGEIQVYHYVLG